MKKTDKKIDNSICLALTQLCENTLKRVTGFVWLTHTVNYKNFPDSLRVICVFDQGVNLAGVNEAPLQAAIQDQLASVGIPIQTQQIRFDTEELCEQQHAGNWKKRLT